MIIAIVKRSLIVAIVSLLLYGVFRVFLSVGMVNQGDLIIILLCANLVVGMGPIKKDAE